MLEELKFKPKSLPEQTSLRLTFVSIVLVYQIIETFCTSKKSIEKEIRQSSILVVVPARKFEIFVLYYIVKIIQSV